MSKRIERNLKAVVYGPWVLAGTRDVETTEAITIVQEPQLYGKPVTHSSTHFPTTGYQYGILHDFVNGMRYNGDPVFIYVDEPPKRAHDTTPKTFTTKIANRVHAAVPSEIADCHDVSGYTWRGLATAAISQIHP